MSSFLNSTNRLVGRMPGFRLDGGTDRLHFTCLIEDSSPRVVTQPKFLTPRLLDSSRAPFPVNRTDQWPPRFQHEPRPAIPLRGTRDQDRGDSAPATVA